MSVVGGELTTPDRIKYIQGKMRIAIQNHAVLWQRLVFNPKDTDVEQMLKILQDIILALGRRQTELMYQYKHDIRQKFPEDTEAQKKAMISELGWPDRDDPVSNGSSAGSDKKPAQLLKKKANLELVRSGQKMTSLLKAPIGQSNQQLLQRKESERLKAAAAKQAESAGAVITKKLAPGLKPKIVLKASRRRSPDEKTASDLEGFPELKESELAGYKLTPQDKATNVDELSQDQYLECFGLVHMDKRKLMVVSHTKRKRRTAAGQSDFYKDFFQPKRPYNRKTLMAGTESPSSSQEVTEAESAEFSPPSEKPSVPPSPAGSSSTEVLDETPREGSPVAAEPGEEGEELEGTAAKGGAEPVGAEESLPGTEEQGKSIQDVSAAEKNSSDDCGADQSVVQTEASCPATEESSTPETSSTENSVPVAMKSLSKEFIEPDQLSQDHIPDSQPEEPMEDSPFTDDFLNLESLENTISLPELPPMTISPAGDLETPLPSPTNKSPVARFTDNVPPTASQPDNPNIVSSIGYESIEDVPGVPGDITSMIGDNLHVSTSDCSELVQRYLGSGLLAATGKSADVEESSRCD